MRYEQFCILIGQNVVLWNPAEDLPLEVRFLGTYSEIEVIKQADRLISIL